MYHLKAQTIGSKLVSKVSVQKKGGKVMIATNMCSNFGGFRTNANLYCSLHNSLLQLVRYGTPIHINA